MHPLAKIIVGIILIVGSVWWIVQDRNWQDFLTVLNGAIPPFVFLLGVFIVWLEIDEWKIERELKEEEERAKREARRKARKAKKRKKRR